MSQTSTERPFVARLTTVLRTHPTLFSVCVFTASTATNLLGALATMSFPTKYPWSWRLEMLRGRYEQETTSLVRRLLRKDMVVVDIGAHIGYFSRLFAKCVGKSGKVIAFEADTENLSLLRRNMALHKNVIIVPKAVSSEIGSITFYHLRGSTGCHSTVPLYDAISGTVPATTLDAFIEQEKITRVDLIKIDIEGGESRAIRGMENTIRNLRPILIVECNKDAIVRGSESVGSFLGLLWSIFPNIYVITSGGLLLVRDAESLEKEIAKTKLGYYNLYCAPE